MSRMAFIDIETTGFSREWCFIIEMAAVIYNEETQKSEDEFQEYIRPKGTIPAKITDLTGITNAMVQNARSEREVLMDFLE